MTLIRARQGILGLAGLMILSSALGALPSNAFAAGTVKRVRLLVGYTPAGGHDLEARVIGRHLPRFMPGKPTVIVQDMPGAGGMIMGAYLYNRVRPRADTLTAGIFGGSHLQAAIIGRGVEYDIGKMPIVWAVRGVRVGIVRDLLNAKSAKDLTKIDAAKIAVAGRSKTDSSCVMGTMAMTLLGIENYRPVCAYKGTAVIRGAMERGEASFFDASDAHFMGNGAFVELYKKHMVVQVWQAGRMTEDGKIVRSPTVREDTPTFLEVYREVHGNDPSGPMWDAFRTLYNNVHGSLNRILVMPPSTPPNRVDMLRKSIASMADDPAFVRDWEKIFGQKFSDARLSWQEAEKIKDNFMKPAEWQESLRKFLNL
jgi:hypothetical protein